MKMNLAGTKPRDVVPRNSTSLSLVTKPTLNGEEHRNASEMENRPRLDQTISDGYGDSLYTPGNELSSTAGKQDYPLPYSAVFSERLETANKSHLSARALSPSDHYADARPPFQRGSKFYPASPTSTEEMKSFPEQYFASLAQLEHDRYVTPTVISPRDTYIEPDVSLVAEWPSTSTTPAAATTTTNTTSTTANPNQRPTPPPIHPATRTKSPAAPNPHLPAPDCASAKPVRNPGTARCYPGAKAEERTHDG